MNLMNRNFVEEHSSSFWFSCLLFANKWGFEPQQELALARISKLDQPAFMIAAGRLCGKDATFLAPYFIKMFERAPTFEDGQALGLNDLVLLCQMQIHQGECCEGRPSRKALYARAVLEGTIKAGDQVGFRKYRRRKEAELAAKAIANKKAGDSATNPTVA